MARSRSSFDVTTAIATAASLTAEEAKALPGQAVKALISFGTTAPPPAPAPSPAPPAAGSAFDGAEAASDPSRMPKLPDLSAIVSPVARCEKIVSWIAEATGASDVFLADAAGLPLAGAIHDADSRLAGAGLVASSIASLATSLPGNHAPLFELHLGEGPFFQIIGFQVGAGLFIVGLTRQMPLSPKQAHAVRLACRQALGDTLRGGS